MSNRRNNTPNTKPQPKVMLGSLPRTTSLFNTYQASTSRARLGPSSNISYSQSCQNLTSVGKTSTHPNIENKCHITKAQEDIEYDLLCSDYLQVMLKKEIMEETQKTHIEELVDQLALQRDILHGEKMRLRKAKSELSEIEKLEESEKIVNSIIDNFKKFETSQNLELDATCESLLGALDSYSKKVFLTNVKIFEAQEDYDKLASLMENCAKIIQRRADMDKDQLKVIDLAKGITQVVENLKEIQKAQESIRKSRTSELLKTLKTLSDSYAKKY